jgi:hypothetical protein
MKKMLKFSVLLLGLTLILGFMGCSTDAGDDDGGSGVSFASASPPSIYVDNNSGEKLVAFKGSLNPNYLISGIPAYATNHGLAKSSTLFSSTGDFALILITETEYTKNKGNLAAAPVFAQIYAFYNHEATNNNSFQISSKSGGTGRITLNNPTSYNIEIRKDGPTGEVLGYAAANLTSTVLRLEAPENYSLYPIFKKYNPIEKEIYSVVPKYTSGNLSGQPFAKDFGLATADGTASWNLSEITVTGFALSSGSFFLRVTNNASTGVRFFQGDAIQTTSTGIQIINPTETNVYTVKITQNPDKTYPASQTISGLKIGTLTNAPAIPSQAYKPDYIYTIEITGSDASNLTLGGITESASPIDLEDLFSSY